MYKGKIPNKILQQMEIYDIANDDPNAGSIMHKYLNQRKFSGMKNRENQICWIENKSKLIGWGILYINNRKIGGERLITGHAMVYILPNFRKKGYGRRIIKKLIANRPKNIKEIYVSKNDSNIARKFFNKVFPRTRSNRIFKKKEDISGTLEKIESYLKTVSKFLNLEKKECRI